MQNLQTNDRIKRNHSNIQMILPPNPASIQSFSKPSNEQYLKYANDFLRAIMEEKGDLTQNLTNLHNGIRGITDFDTLNKFCSHFPYDVFFNFSINGETPKICLLSLIIFSYCTNSKKFPREKFEDIDNVSYIFSLFEELDKKYHNYLFNILDQFIVYQPEFRNYLLQNGILNYFNPQSSNAIKFLATCLTAEPDIEKEYANTINVLLILSIDRPAKDRQKKLDSILAVLSIFTRREQNQCDPIYNPDVTDPSLLKYIFNDLIHMNFLETFAPILKVALLVDLDDEIFIPIIMNYIKFICINKKRNVIDAKVIRYCMEILNSRSEQWNDYEEIYESVISVLDSNEGQLSFFLIKCLIQILMSYAPIEPEMNFKSLYYVFEYITDKEIGPHCLNFVLQSFSVILQSEDTNENKTNAINLIDSNLETIEEIADGNDCSEESQNFAISILKLMDDLKKD